jgi:polar amino acid transport system substrate-binding protein
MTIRRHLIASTLLASGLFGGLSTAFAQTDTLTTMRQAKVIRLGLEFGRPPWAFKDEKLKMTGSDLETAELLATDLGLKLEIVELTGPNRIPFLQANKVDVVLSGFSITPERQKVVDFSTPYVAAGVAVGAPKPLTLKSVGDLKGHRVGVTRGTTADGAVTKQAAELGVEVTRFEDESTTMTALASGQIEIVLQEPATLMAVAARNPARQIERKFTFIQFPVGIGMRKNDGALKNTLDQWVRNNLANGKLNAIYKKFHGLDLPPEILQPAP